MPGRRWSALEWNANELFTLSQREYERETELNSEITSGSLIALADRKLGSKLTS